jgi:hypothetical protein
MDTKILITYYASELAYIGRPSKVPEQSFCFKNQIEPHDDVIVLLLGQEVVSRMPAAEDERDFRLFVLEPIL